MKEGRSERGVPRSGSTEAPTPRLCIDRRRTRVGWKTMWLKGRDIYVERNYAREVRPISFVRRRFDPGKVPQKHSFPLERIVGQQSAIKCSEVGFQCSMVLCGHIVESYVDTTLWSACVHIVERSAKTLDTPGNPTHTSKARGRVTVMERMNLQVQEFVSFLRFFNLFSPD